MKVEIDNNRKEVRCSVCGNKAIYVLASNFEYRCEDHKE